MKRGTKVIVKKTGWTATIKKILSDGDFLLDDGKNDGVYSVAEVEEVK